ncbi:MULTISPECIES: 23S rRNA (adenine(2503)-C(2))-methyltransferase RlmN [Bacteroidales]|jgi:23S rRNA m2A2503 methyltransferase|uniref:23S rRNA (adenine(2503)-C(2))-methyltransferase RlmN n=1 Tax=Bacteroidales TaxID=171549 RepID=UPI0006D7B611|nr:MULTISPECIES: 23S rRNA (adenine(2503)-C(2))-methyltransferase RlmN [Bacteroidales]
MDNKSEKKHLAGMSASEITEVVESLGMPRFTAKQIVSWLYEKRVNSIDEMTDLSKVNRGKLLEKYDVGYVAPVQEMRSVDGTVKYLFATSHDSSVEAVYIPDKERATLCVSSQVGCKMNCLFCMTGKQGFTRNLTANEILNQIISIPESRTLTNLVFMGMGEPFDNIDELMKVLSILTSEWGFAWSPKRITVSTIGHRVGMERFLKESDCHLAVSLHSPFPVERLSLMPVEKAYPEYEIIEKLRQYDFSKQRRLSFEYIMFRGLNDSLRHAEELVRLLKGLHCRINLIRFHAIPDVALRTSDESSMVQFRNYLTRKGIICTIRSSRGEDIFAACGMLSTARTQKMKLRE